MNLKLFQTRLDEPNFRQDQETINAFMESVTVKKTATQFVIGQPDFWSVLVFYENGKPKKPAFKDPDKLSVEADIELSPDEREINSALKAWRRDKASTLNVPDYLICHNAELLAVTKLRPRTMEELSRVKGFGDQKIAKYGDDIIAVLNAF